MEQTLSVRGKEFISAKLAAARFGYESDYIGQLIRKGKIDGKLVGRSWFLNPAELKEYMENRSREARGRKRGTRVAKKATVSRIASNGASVAQMDLDKLPGVTENEKILEKLWPEFSKRAAENLISSSTSVQRTEIKVAPQLDRVGEVEQEGLVKESETTPQPSKPKTEAAAPVQSPVMKKAPVESQTPGQPRSVETVSPVRIEAEQTEIKKVMEERILKPKNTATNIDSSGNSQTRIVPIKYHIDESPLMPVLVRAIRPDVVTRPSQATQVALPAQMAAASALSGVHKGYFQSFGKLIGAAFALSAVVFALASGFVHGTFDVIGGYASQGASAAAPGALSAFQASAIAIYQSIHSIIQSLTI